MKSLEHLRLVPRLPQNWVLGEAKWIVFVRGYHHAIDEVHRAKRIRWLINIVIRPLYYQTVYLVSLFAFVVLRVGVAAHVWNEAVHVGALGDLYRLVVWHRVPRLRIKVRTPSSECVFVMEAARVVVLIAFFGLLGEAELRANTILNLIHVSNIWFSSTLK